MSERSVRTWPSDWERRRAGEGCSMCADPRADVNSLGDQRVLAGSVCDAYLVRREIVRGYVVAAWRGRHVSDVTELNDDEAAEFERCVRVVARAVEAHYRPAKLNLMALGNAVPHLHVHVVPRYVDDPDPGRPHRFMMTDSPPGEQPLIPEDRYRSEVAALRGLVADALAAPDELATVGRVALGAAAAIFDAAGRILLVRHGYGPNNWELPGGAALVGESPEETAVREVAEETGLVVVPERITGVYPERAHRLGPILHFVVRCRREPPDAEPRITSDEITDVRWVDTAELPRPISDFTVRRLADARADRPLLSHAVSGRVWLPEP